MAATTNRAAETDRVRRYTSPELLRQIDEGIERNIQFYGAQPDHVIARRIEELHREWSMERCLQANIAGAGLLTGFLALSSNRTWGLLTGVALGFFLYHSLRGYDPPFAALRRMGVRTRSEIDREKHALKALRGDYRKFKLEEVRTQGVSARQILNAVSA